MATRPAASERIDLAIEEGTPARGRQPVTDQGAKVVGKLGLGCAAHRAGNTHEYDSAQAIGVERAGPATPSRGRQPAWTVGLPATSYRAPRAIEARDG